jgi:aryl-alcohol dehydrogenase-like predicted oxidoreductase
MEYCQLGRSDLKVSKICFGCMSLKVDAADNEQLIHAAIDKGINFFDTADLYDKGKNEELIGKALKGKRQTLIIATKVGNQWREDGSGWDWNPTTEYILTSVEKSLQRLQTDYIDIYQLHGGTINDPIDETIEAFEQLKKQGKIRHYGISSIRPNVIREYVKRSSIISVMMQYGLLDRRPEETAFGLLQENKISVLARGAMAQGLLINKPAKPYISYSEEEVRKAAAAVQSANTNRRPAHTALQFVWKQPVVASAVVGIRTIDQLNEAADAVSSAPLLMEEYNMLATAIKPLMYAEHR